MLVRPLSTVDNIRDYARVSHSRQWSRPNYNNRPYTIQRDVESRWRFYHAGISPFCSCVTLLTGQSPHRHHPTASLARALYHIGKVDETSRETLARWLRKWMDWCRHPRTPDNWWVPSE